MIMMAQKRMDEQALVERELSLLMETTLRLEEDLNSFTKIDEE